MLQPYEAASYYCRFVFALAIDAFRTISLRSESCTPEVRSMANWSFKLFRDLIGDTQDQLHPASYGDATSVPHARSNPPNFGRAKLPDFDAERFLR